MIFLGTIANAGSDVKNNSNTAAPFVIPTGVTMLRLQPSAATMMASVALGDNPSFAPNATDQLQLGGANSFNDLPIPGTAARPGVVFQLAVRKTDAGAGTTKVFALAIP